MRAYERQAGESAKAFEAYKQFRDAGPGRTLRKAAETYYGSTANLRQIQEWSRKFDWVARARQRDDYIDMIRCRAVEEQQQARAADLAARESALREQNLLNEEQAARVEAKFLDYAERLIDELPLVRQVTVREGEDGKPAIYQVEPATKDAVLDAERLVELAGTSDVVGTPMMSVATVPRPPNRLLAAPPRFAPRSPRAAPVSAATVRQYATF